MSEVLNFNRLWLLVKRYWTDNRRIFLFSALTILLLMLVIFTLGLLTSWNHRIDAETQSVIFFIGLFLSGTFFGSILFSDLGSKSRGIAYLALPASRLEKLLTAVFYAIIVFPAVYMSIFYLLDTATIKISNEIRYKSWQAQKAANDVYSPDWYDSRYDRFEPSKVINVFQYEDYRYLDDTYEAPNDTPNFYMFLWCGFFGLQAFYAMGSVFFGRFSFIKTSVFLFAIALLFVLVFAIIYQIVPGYYDITRAAVYEEGASYFYEIPKPVLDTELFILKFILAPLFWLIAFVRLKEKEI